MPEHKNQYEQIEQATGEQLLILDDDLSVKAASKSFYTVFQTTLDLLVGKNLVDLDKGQWNLPALLTLLHELPESDGNFDDFAMEHDSPRVGP